MNSLETIGGKTSVISLLFNTPYGIDYANECYNIIDSITPDDILNTANYIFNSKPIYSITGTKETIEANKEFLEGLAD